MVRKKKLLDNRYIFYLASFVYNDIFKRCTYFTNEPRVNSFVINKFAAGKYFKR